ncbi:MAG: hypothetical protein GW748_07795 [Alphaproteobacteria bacterium]|nr:hypothetical protein [Alphaproteobacteria bacterium]
MKKTIKNNMLAVVIALTSLSAVNASLTEEASNALLSVDLGEAIVVATAFPGADLEGVITTHSESILAAPTGDIPADFATLRGTLGGQAEYDATQGAVALLDDAPANGVGSFVDGTSGSAMPLHAALADTSYETQNRALLRAAFNIMNIGINGGGNQNGVLGALNEDTVTWSHIVQAIATIADHG